MFCKKKKKKSTKVEEIGITPKLTKTGQGKRGENWRDFSSHKKKKEEKNEKNWRYF